MALVRADDVVLRSTAWLMLVTDIGFIVYWLLIATRALPPELMFDDYQIPSVAAWNWSFLPLDVAISVTGLWALGALRRGRASARVLLPVSLTLTSVSGGMALSYWAIAGDFDIAWWAPNAYLLIFPIPLLIRLARRPEVLAPLSVHAV